MIRICPAATGALLAAALLCALARPVRGQVSAPPGEPSLPRIGSITFQHNYLLSEAQLRQMLGLREGASFDEAKLSAAVEAWNKEGLYGVASYRAEPAGEGAVAIILSVAERVDVTTVRFRGNDRFSDRRLRDLADVEAGERVSEMDVHSAERRIVAAYEDAGYASASVRGRMGEVGAARRELVFDVTEGPRTWVEEVQFAGNEHVPAHELRSVMQTKTRHFPSWIWPGWYKEATFRDDVRAVEAAYRERGYLDATADGTASFDKGGTRATLRVAVSEGPLYRVADVSFEGNLLFRDDELRKALPLQVGDAYNPEKLGDAADAISALYADQGYWDVTEAKGNLRAEEVVAPEGTDVSLEFRIAEGEPVFIRRIHIRGLTKTKDLVIRRNLTFHPGERARADAFRESERALANTGYLDPLSPRPARVTLEPDEGVLRDAVVQVEEGATGRLLLSVGVGSESGLLGGVSVEENNFDLWNWPGSWNDLWNGTALRGGGQRVGITLNAGTEQFYYAITFENPSVWNTDYSLGTALYSQGLSRNEFDEVRTGFSVTGGHRLSKDITRRLTVGLEEIEVHDTDAGAPPVIKNEEGTHHKAFARLGGVVDRRDVHAMPTEGYLLTGELEGAAGDVETVKLQVEARRYWTVWQRRGKSRHVLGLRGRAGVMDSYSGDVPVYERFYAGGSRTLRGFAYEGASPTHPVTGDQIGGESMLLGSTEYSLPLTQSERTRLVGFCDAGYVERDKEDLLSGWDELRASVGVGVRWRVPEMGGFSIEFDLAAPVLKEPHDETQYIHFSMGAQTRF